MKKNINTDSDSIKKWRFKMAKLCINKFKYSLTKKNK